MTHLARALAAFAMLPFAACGDGTPAPPNVTFDGARALEYVKLQVEAGPRIPGTTPHKLVGDRIVQELRKNADTVVEQTWKHVTATGDTLPLRNIFAQFNPRAAIRILYVSHWDSRPHADNSFALDDKKKPVPGADDGASSTALLIVLAEALKAQPTTVGVDLLFTDAEDYGDFGPPEVDVLIGAKYYAEHILPDSSYRPMFGVLWDMIGNKGVRIMKESTSDDHYPEVNDRIWKMAAALGYSSVFVNALYPIGSDDHIPLIAKRFPIVDVIDLQGYPYHHTTQDTIDKVSAESLTIMGRVALALIRAEEAKK